jgi:hydrogenase-4 membrane subunit HyfE
MTCYTDEYQLLCYTVIKFQPLVFHTCNIIKFNVPFCAIQTKQPHFYTRKTLTVVLKSAFSVLSQQLFGVTTEKREISQIFLTLSQMGFYISIVLKTPNIYFQLCGLQQQ